MQKHWIYMQNLDLFFIFFPEGRHVFVKKAENEWVQREANVKKCLQYI